VQEELASCSVITLAQIVEEKDNHVILADDKIIQTILQVKKSFNNLWVLCTNVDPILIADQRNFKAKYMQNSKEN